MTEEERDDRQDAEPTSDSGATAEEQTPEAQPDDVRAAAESDAAPASEASEEEPAPEEPAEEAESIEAEAETAEPEAPAEPARPRGWAGSECSGAGRPGAGQVRALVGPQGAARLRTHPRQVRRGGASYPRSHPARDRAGLEQTA